MRRSARPTVVKQLNKIPHSSSNTMKFITCLAALFVLLAAGVATASPTPSPTVAVTEDQLIHNLGQWNVSMYIQLAIFALALAAPFLAVPYWSIQYQTRLDLEKSDGERYSSWTWDFLANPRTIAIAHFLFYVSLAFPIVMYYNLTAVYERLAGMSSKRAPEVESTTAMIFLICAILLHKIGTIFPRVKDVAMARISVALNFMAFAGFVVAAICITDQLSDDEADNQFNPEAHYGDGTSDGIVEFSGTRTAIQVLFWVATVLSIVPLLFSVEHWFFATDKKIGRLLSRRK